MDVDGSSESRRSCNRWDFQKCVPNLTSTNYLLSYSMKYEYIVLACSDYLFQ